MKVCSKCHIEKDENEFPKYKLACKSCVKKRTKEWRKNNIEIIRQKEKEYAVKNIGRIKKYKKIYSLVNKEYINNWHKDEYQRNKTSYIKRAAHWRKKNKERFKEINRKSHKKGVVDLKEWYIKDATRRRGITNEIIKEYPLLINIKMEEIKNKREIKKQTI